MLALLALGMATAARADVISIAWTPVVHPDLVGYRVEIDAQAGSYAGAWDLSPAQTSHSVAVLEGGCRVYCASVSSLGPGALAGAPAMICGLPDPEVFNVAQGSSGWRVLGDNFAANAQVYLDGSQTPVSSTRLGCGELRIPLPPLTKIVVRNPADGVAGDWSAPASGYLLDEHPGAVILECRIVGNALAPTVTRFSQTPGLAIGVEADVVGVGTDCAQALATVVQATLVSPSEIQALPLDDAGGLLYVIAFD